MRRRTQRFSLSTQKRRVSDDDVELHIASKQLGYPSFDVVGVNERISVVLKFFLAIQDRFRRVTELTFGVNP